MKTKNNKPRVLVSELPLRLCADVHCDQTATHLVVINFPVLRRVANYDGEYCAEHAEERRRALQYALEGTVPLSGFTS